MDYLHRKEQSGQNSSPEQRRQDKTRGFWKTLSAIGLFLLAFGGKLKFLLPLLKLGKVGGMVWSMLLAMGVYALIYPWSFSVGIVLMIFVHEMGHLIAAKRKGLPVSAPAFIPFVGALVTMKKAPQDAATEAYIALGGPLLGTAGAILAFFLGNLFDAQLFYLLAWFGFFINLLNLLPIYPLDGGRIVTAISRKLWVAGLVGGLVVIVWLRSLLFFIIWAFFAWQLYASYRQRRSSSPQTMNAEEQVPVSLFTESGVPMPGPNHTRDLDAVTYSRLHDRKTYVELVYPGVGSINPDGAPFPWGTVTKARLKETHYREGNDDLIMRVELTYLPDESIQLFREERYYQVEPATRAVYGAVYFGLAAGLAILLYLSSGTLPAV